MRESAQTERVRLSHDEAAGAASERGTVDRGAGQFGKLFLMMQDPYIPAGAGGLSVPLADRSELSIFPRLSTYSQIVAKLQWDPTAIDLAARRPCLA